MSNDANLLASVVIDVTGPLIAENDMNEIAGTLEAAVSSLSFSLHEAYGDRYGVTFTVRDQ